MIAIEVRKLSVFYGHFQALKDVSLKIEKQKITALIGPSGCGKTTFLRCLNRMNDLIDEARVEGEVIINGLNIYQEKIDLLELRRRVGMVFQRPNPFPLSIEANILYGLKVHGLNDRKIMEERLERSLRSVQLWDELKDCLKKMPFRSPLNSSSVSAWPGFWLLNLRFFLWTNHVQPLILLLRPGSKS